MALQGNDRAYLTGRTGCAKVGASRIGFVPKHTTGTGNAFYVWSNKVGTTSNKPSGTWIAKQR